MAEQTVTFSSRASGADCPESTLRSSVRFYAQRSCVLSIRARPLLASTTLSAF
jgi:hypothetical protein